MTTKRIPLTNGQQALVDSDDYPVLVGYSWCVDSTGYPVSWRDKQKVVMHRLIIGLSSTMDVDHRDLNKLNNTRANLRLCTRSQNNANRPKFNLRGHTSRFKGVSKRRNRWRASVKYNRKQRYLGSYDTEHEAAEAYDKAAKELFGEFARTNF